ncbi:MAG: putative Type secretion rane fusion protein HlyD [Nitrospira sp.]|nr:putative Type secretion rane fusion protein HlyD [Nitrospira sp.]
MIHTIRRQWEIWGAAWRAERKQPFAVGTSGEAAEFLPAVLEIQQTQPSPIGRGILWTIMALLTVFVAWASVGRIDIVATAQGKIIPSGHSKMIQPYETGVIASIQVQDGQIVHKGDVLIELDPTQNRADRDRALNEHRAARVEAARLRALIAGAAILVAPPESDPQYVWLQQQLLRDQMAEYQARVDAAQQVIVQRRAAIGVTVENIRRLAATVPMETERAGAFKRLMERDAVTKLDYLQAEGQRIDKLQELAGQQHKLRQDQAALAEAKQNLGAMVSEFQQTKQAELSAIDTKASSLSQEVTKAGQKAELQRLVSPIDGVAQQLVVHTVGGVVTPAQPLLIVVPQDHPVEVEAQLENKDVGFVKEGQAAEIKIETFPFTVYGTIPGTVLTVSDDAVPIDKDKPADSLVFATRVSLARGTIPVEGKVVHLSPGMAVTVEIKTGRRRVIEYLLSPVLKTLQESLRER